MPDEADHWALHRQLSTLRDDLRRLVAQDLDHEVEGNAVSVIDELLEEAKTFVGADDRLIARVEGTFTVDAFEKGVRAADLELVVSILVERVGTPPGSVYIPGFAENL
jgi:hypothetical protein